MSAMDRDRLAQAVKERRRELRLSVSAAARAASVARNTWDGVETGQRKLAEFNYAGVEVALNWAHGSIDAVLTGGHPTPLSAPPEPVEVRDDTERDIMDSPLPLGLRLRLIDRYRDRKDEALRRAAAETQDDLRWNQEQQEQQRDVG
jgi:hypothetical protein